MDVDVIQKLALAVDPPDAYFDPELQPETGEQYLQKVIYERNHCPAVVVVKPNFQHNKTTKNLTGSGLVPTDPVQNIAPRVLIPTKEWESIQNKQFADLRNTITSYRNSKHYRDNLEKTHVFLNFENRKQMHDYCANNQPYVRVLLSIPQRNLELLLEYLYDWLQGCQADDHMAECKSYRKDWITQWIYAILACIIVPLEPYIHSILRDIAKACIVMRNELTAEEESKVLPLNLLICIISRNFNQLDLRDNLD
ncbi:protein Gemin2 [Wyeomyia smithii]|uniref:protein Gemin2 n=1 Tax=Wyeomyia smithii TaxID=174621 RepID=UPI0024681F73|nr:protein Gemin2 [Wyeomyia smithii]